jgi:hypothetical protein
VTETSYTRTLARAAEAAGSLQCLAEQLEVSEHNLRRWLRGVSTPPAEIYFAALDMVARGPFRNIKKKHSPK